MEEKTGLSVFAGGTGVGSMERRVGRHVHVASGPTATVNGPESAGSDPPHPAPPPTCAPVGLEVHVKISLSPDDRCQSGHVISFTHVSGLPAHGTATVNGKENYELERSSES